MLIEIRQVTGVSFYERNGYSFKYLSVTVSDIDSIFSTFDLDECRTGCDRWKNLQRKYLQLINEKSETRQSFCPTHIWDDIRAQKKIQVFSKNCIGGNVDWKCPFHPGNAVPVAGAQLEKCEDGYVYTYFR